MNRLLELINTPPPSDALSTKQYWMLRAIRERKGHGPFQALKTQAGLSPVIPLHRLTKWEASKVIAASEEQPWIE